MSNSEYFDDVASRWDEMRSGFYSAHVRDAALAAGCVEPGMTAADIGGGTGFITEELVEKGLRVITDLDAHDFEFLREEHHDQWMGFERSDLERWFRGAGLSGVSVKDVGENCCAESACGTESASVSIFVASGVK